MKIHIVFLKNQEKASTSQHKHLQDFNLPIHHSQNQENKKGESTKSKFYADLIFKETIVCIHIGKERKFSRKVK